MNETPAVLTAAEEIRNQDLACFFFKSGSSEASPPSEVAFKRQQYIQDEKQLTTQVPLKSRTSRTGLVFPCVHLTPALLGCWS